MDKLTMRVTLRMGEELHQLLSEAARKGDRPLNTEILRRLASTFSEAPKLGVADEDLLDSEGLTEAQEKRVLELIRQELGKC